MAFCVSDQMMIRERPDTRTVPSVFTLTSMPSTRAPIVHACWRQ